MSQDFNIAQPKNIIIGSSRTLALNPIEVEEKTNIKFLNLSVASAKLPYVYYTLLRLVRSGERINSVYIDIPASNNMNARLKGAFGENFIRSFITEIEMNDFLVYYPNAFEYYNDSRKFGKDYVNKDLYKIIIGYVKFLLNKNGNIMLEKRLVDTHGYMLLGNANKISSKKQSLKYRKIVANLTKNDVPQVHEEYLIRILKLLKDENIKYKFFFSPYPSESKKLENLGIGNYVNLLAMIPQGNRNDDPLILDESLFIDGSHLNLNGSKVFTDYFVQEVLNIDIGKKFETYPIRYNYEEEI